MQLLSKCTDVLIDSVECLIVQCADYWNAFYVQDEIVRPKLVVKHFLQMATFTTHVKMYIAHL